MGKWAKVLGLTVLVVASVAVAAELGITPKIEKASWRYRITVEVETPEGIKTGFAVREITVERVEPEIQGLYQTRALVEGEAVVVDLGKRGLLFAPLQGSSAYQVVFDAFPGPPGFTREGLNYYSHLSNVQTALKPENYPRMIWFRDIKEPTSVELVWDGEFYDKPKGLGFERAFRVKEDNFTKIFGDHVKLKEIKIAMTREPVTTQIESYLPWLKQFSDRMLDGKKYNTIKSANPLANSMSATSFTTEISDNE